jgi:pantoate--beta-alanine ligase
MITVHTIEDLRLNIPKTKRVALVPTMGNLHDGHLDLLKKARSVADFVVASIFVNRLQFSPHEDFDAYPRTILEDSKKLNLAGCDLLFAPSEQDFYPVVQGFKVLPPPELANILEGEFRPGFFTGVCTVVNKLLNCVQPNVALFGRKDYQQQMVIKHMVDQMALPIQIIAVPTRREADGLAMSSRNGYLSGAERREAVHLYKALCRMRDAFTCGQTLESVEREAKEYLKGRGWSPDYLCIRDARDLRVPSIDTLTELKSSYTNSDTSSQTTSWVALAAARLGKTRLIDNIEFE